MPVIYINQFNGKIPRLAPRGLPDYNSQIASNVKLVSGELRPLRRAAVVSRPITPMPATSIYQARNGDNAGWLTWQRDVDVVRAPLPSEVESRYYWSGDGEPRYGKFTDVTTGGDNDYPKIYYALGVPVPQTKPTVSASGGVGSSVTRFYCYTYFSALGEESGPSPIATEFVGKVDGTWAISAMDEVPVSSGVGTAAHAAGVTTFTDTASAKHWLRKGDEVIISGTLLVVGSVPTAYSFTVPGDLSAATTWARKAPWNTAGMKRRLYRTSGSIGSFQLVADDVPATYSDTVIDANILGDALITSGWLPPDPSYKGFLVHASGSVVAFNGTQLAFSVPYQPHAWVASYTLGTEFEIVGTATFGSDIAVATKGVPCVASGVEPESMTMQKISGLYPCLSKRSMVSVGDGAIYASKQGLIYLGASGVRVYTEQLYTKDEWALENPSQMVCEFAYGRVFIATVSPVGLPYVITIDDLTLTTADISAHDLFTDPATGTLYLATDEAIGEWDTPGASPLNASWKSKMFVSPPPINLGAAKIEFDAAVPEDVRQAILAEIALIEVANAGIVASGETLGGYNGASYCALAINGSAIQEIPEVPASNLVTFILYSKGLPIFSRVVASEKAFRLPAGYKADEIEIQVNGQCTINAIRIADTMTNLSIS